MSIADRDRNLGHIGPNIFAHSIDGVQSKRLPSKASLLGSWTLQTKLMVSSPSALCADWTWLTAPCVVILKRVALELSALRDLVLPVPALLEPISLGEAASLPDRWARSGQMSSLHFTSLHFTSLHFTSLVL